jgi:SAM-dependent methyltransferase
MSYNNLHNSINLCNNSCSNRRINHVINHISANNTNNSIVHSAAQAGYSSDQSTQLYVAGRPSYPLHLVKSILDNTLITAINNNNSIIRIVDLGAGTGKFTEVLIEVIKTYQKQYNNVSFHIIAVEPVEGMRKKFSHLLPDIAVVAGSADSIPLAANSVDLVISAQSFHWFANYQSLIEIHRILKNETGALALIWNTRDTTVDWVAALEGEINKYYGPDVPRQQTKQWIQAFYHDSAKNLFNLPLSEAHYSNEVVQQGSIDIILARVLSISVIGQLPQQEQDEIAERVRNLVLTHPSTAGLTHYTLPYRTHIYWSFKQ